MQIVETAIFVNLSKFTAHAGITGVALPAVDCTLLTEWQVSFAFFQPGSPAAALPGATFRFALKETPTGDPLIFNSSLTASGAVYTADISSVDSAALRTLIGDQPSIAVVGEIEWTISSRRERVHFPVTVTNAWARPDDAAPDPVAEASIVWFTEQLATRAVRFDVAQTLTSEQKAQGRDNLGITGTGGSAAWADITGKPSTFPPSAHTHAIADVTGLQTALDAKAASSHTHSAADITTGALAIANGGTGSTTALAAREALGLRLAVDVQPHSNVLDALLPLNVLDTPGDVGTTLQLGSGANYVGDNATTSGGDGGEISLVGGDAYGDALIQRNGGDAGSIQMLGGHASDQYQGGAAGSVNTSASGQYLGGSLLMNATDRNAGSINTQAGGNLTMGTANVSGPAVAGTLLTDASSLPAANLTGTIANARLPSTITGLTSVTSTTFVGALTGVASGNLVAGGALGTPSSGALTNCTSIPAGNLTGTVATARLGSGTADATTYLRGDATWATVSGGSSGYTVKTANYTAVAGDKIATNLTAGSFTITLPATPAEGDSVEIIPAAGTNGSGNFGGHTLTVARNGSTINGSAADITSTMDIGMKFVYASSSWRTRALLRFDGSHVSRSSFNGLNIKTVASGGFPIEYYAGNGNAGYQFGVWNGSWPTTPSRLTNYSTLMTWSAASGRGVGFGSSTGSTTLEILGVNDGYAAWFRGMAQFQQITTPAAGPTNSAQIYSKDVSGTAEMFVMDEAGNETQISPHNTAAPESLVDSAFDEVGYTANYYTGIVTYSNKQRQIAGRADAQFFETFAEHNQRTGDTLTIWHWDTVQADHVAKREEEREAWATRKAEWEANSENKGTPFLDTEPELVTAKPQPQWLIDQLAGKEAFLANRLQFKKSWSSKAEFWAEFTDTEKAAIITSEDIGVKMLDKELTMWSGVIIATDSRVIAGLDKLVELEIITETRRTEIISL